MSNEEIELRALIASLTPEERAQLVSFVSAAREVVDLVHHAIEFMHSLPHVPDVKRELDRYVISNAPELYPEVEITHNDPSE